MPFSLRLKLTYPLSRLPYKLLILKILRHRRITTTSRKHNEAQKFIRQQRGRNNMLKFRTVTTRFIGLTSNNQPLRRRQYTTKCRVHCINTKARVNVSIHCTVPMRTDNGIRSLLCAIVFRDPFHLFLVDRKHPYQMKRQRDPGRHVDTE